MLSNLGAKVRIIIEIANKNKIKRANDVMTPICLNSPEVILITPNRNLNSPKVIFVTLEVFCFYAERQNVPHILTFSLGMPL